MQRATHLTGQILTFSRGGHPVREAVRLEELVADTVRFDLSGSRVKPKFTFAPDLWPAKVDMGQIQQVFSNLTINAVQAMPDGGHIHASSRPGRGTTFTLYLPASDEDRPHEGDAAGTGERIDTSDIHILVMDDEAMVRDIALEMLEKNGCRVQTASDGEMAIEMYGDAMEKAIPLIWLSWI